VTPLLERTVVGRRCVVAAAGACAACRVERLRRQGGPQLAPPVVHDVVRSAGRPLEAAVRGGMDPLWLARVNHYAIARLRAAFTSPKAEYQRAFSAPGRLRGVLR
jgi:hypothetical protein